MPHGGGRHFVLRESYREDGGWKHRDIADLGADPSEYIEYPGGNGYYIRPDLEDLIQQAGIEYTAEEIENIFLPFLDPRIRRIIENFRRSPSRYSGNRRESSDSHRAHWFDKRRIHFLKFGRIDIGNIDGEKWGFQKILRDKSRDEIEHVIEGMEAELRPREFMSYIYTAFNLESYFSNHLLRHHPAALDPEKIDSFFLEEICSINQDARFFRGMDRDSIYPLHPMLQKYVIIYFDGSVMAGNTWSEAIKERLRQRMNRARTAPSSQMGKEEALEVIGIAESELQCMTLNRLTKHYRRKAQEMHPDKGGDHEGFLKLTEAYNILLSML